MTMSNIIQMPNTADAINKAVDIVFADWDMKVWTACRPDLAFTPSVRTDDERQRMKARLENLLVEHPECRRPTAEALADLYWIAWEKCLDEDSDDDDDSDDDNCG